MPLVSASKSKSPIKLLYTLLKICGALNHEKRPWSFINSAFNFLCVLAVGVTSFLKAYLDDGELFQRTEALSLFVTCIHCQAKAINMLYRQHEIRNLFDRLEGLRDEMLQDIDHRHHVINAEKLLRKLLPPIFFFILGLPLNAFSFSLFNYYLSGELHMPMQMWVPWEIHDAASYFKGSVFVTITALLGDYNCVVSDLVLVIFTIEISAILKILQDKLRTSGHIDKSTYRLHSNTIQLLKDYNRIFCAVLYLEMLLSSLQPCGFVYATIKHIKRRDPRFIESLYKIIMFTSLPFCICLCGEEINSQIEKLHESSYMNQWYEERASNRKVLLNVMTAAVKPSLLSYRHVITFNFACFASAVQGMYTFLSMLIQFETSD